MRFVRAAVTMICCISGAGYVLWNNWFVGDWSVLTFLELAVRVYVLNPLADYFLHRYVHWSPKSAGGKYHHAHHVEIKLPNGHLDAETLEVWCYPVAIACYATPYTKWITLGLLQYAWFHQLSHDLPELVPGMARHHGIHHMTTYKNHGVSFSWPDRVFGTYQADVPRKCTPPSRLGLMIEARDAE